MVIHKAKTDDTQKVKIQISNWGRKEYQFNFTELLVGFHGVPERTTLISKVPKYCRRKQKDERHYY